MLLAVTAVALAACGGAAEPRLPVRLEAAPVLVTLTSPQGAGSDRLRSGDLAGARAACEAELAATADRLGPLNDLAVGYLLEGHVDAAQKLLDEVVANGSPREQQVALLNLGELFAVEGHATAALAYFETARSLDATRPEPLYALALLADDRGDLAGAHAALREALRADEGGAARSGFAYAFPEERRHLDALLAELAGDRGQADVHWRGLAGGRFPALAAAAARHLAER
jgi:tetratricopeptide (TPR) repeat protein